MKICIIGGGTAGWLAALWITKLRANWADVTVIESSKIGIIGAGEGTTGSFFNIIQNRWGKFGINEADFIRETGATHKLGIKFERWTTPLSSYIAPIDNTPAVKDHYDPVLIDHCLRHGVDRAHLTTLCGNLAEHNLSSYDRDYATTYGYNAYHFDGHRVGQYFKKLAAPLCEQVIDAEVVDVTVTEQGVSSVKLSTGETIAADYWIDASGFARVLSRALGTEWHSYSRYLTCDRAMPFILPHSEHRPVRPLTVSRAMNAGWQWRIPTQDRWGCGYVYDSNHKTEDQALKELELDIGQPVEPIKIIKFDPGRLVEAYKKNTVSIGLAGSFLEPLQATSIHGTIAQLQCFDQLMFRPGHVHCTTLQNARANEIFAETTDQFADLIQLHYKSGRNDTDFWQKQQQTAERSNVTYLRELVKHRWPTDQDWHLSWGTAGYGVFIYPMINYGWINWETVARLLPRNMEHYSARWQRHAKLLVDRCLPHSEMMANTDRLQNLRFSQEFDTIKEPLTRPKNTQPIHPLLRGIL